MVLWRCMLWLSHGVVAVYVVAGGGGVVALARGVGCMGCTEDAHQGVSTTKRLLLRRRARHAPRTFGGCDPHDASITAVCGREDGLQRQAAEERIVAVYTVCATSTHPTKF
jgi:hypothetical protein